MEQSPNAALDAAALAGDAALFVCATRKATIFALDGSPSSAEAAEAASENLIKALYKRGSAGVDDDVVAGLRNTNVRLDEVATRLDTVVAGLGLAELRNTNVRLDELAAALADIKTLTIDLKADIKTRTDDLKTLTIESYNMAAYAYNSTSRALSDTLKPLRNAAGNTPNNFPPTPI